MAELDHVWYKIKNVVKKFIPGINNSRVPKSIWERQFADGYWNYLESDDERGHYEVIVDFYNKHSNAGSILDIGCGKGVLYKYFHETANLSASKYHGIDISENAIKAAKERFREADFKTVDYQYHSIDKKVDTVIFNETLCYFYNPIETLNKSIKENLNSGGRLIVSLCDYGNHDEIWKLIEDNFKVLESRQVSNSKQQLWKIKALAVK